MFYRAARVRFVVNMGVQNELLAIAVHEEIVVRLPNDVVAAVFVILHAVLDVVLRTRVLVLKYLQSKITENIEKEFINANKFQYWSTFTIRRQPKDKEDGDNLIISLDLPDERNTTVENSTGFYSFRLHNSPCHE